MARVHIRSLRQVIARRTRVVALAAVTAAGCAAVVPASTAGAAVIAPTSASWCTVHGSTVGGWVQTTPALPICGPGPAYGGTWRYVTIPGPFGSLNSYFNATPGFQCVELAERYLSVVDGLAPVHANGATVAMNYHAAYPTTSLIVNGSVGAIGHAPAAGDVLSLSGYAGFVGTDGHVAVVVSSSVNGLGNGTVTIAQQNVSSADYTYTLGMSGWRLYDPAEPQNALFQYHYAEWLSVPSVRATAAQAAQVQLVKTVTAAVTAALLPHTAHRAAAKR